MTIKDTFKKIKHGNLQDLPIRKRLLISNIFMVLIPIIIMILLSIAMFNIVKQIHPIEESIKMQFPNRGDSVTVEVLLSTLQGDIEQSDVDQIERLQGTLRRLETYGVKTAIVKNNTIVRTTAKLANDTVQELLVDTIHTHVSSDVLNGIESQDATNTTSQSYLVWNKNGLQFKFTSHDDAIIVVGYGKVPFIIGHKDLDNRPNRGLRVMLDRGLIIILIIGFFIIIALGTYVSRLLSKQITEPLDELQTGAKRIQNGNLDTQINILGHDEFGETCKVFDDMRKELKTSRETQVLYENNRRELIAGISHDLATPLTMIKGYASGIIDGIANTPEKQVQYIQHIQQTSNQMESLVNELFLFSKLDLGRVEFIMIPISMRDYLQDLLDETRQTYENRGLKITVHGQPEYSKVSIDHIQFKRVVTNILENSLKYKNTPIGQIDISMNTDNTSLSIKFADHGPGVDTESLEHLFESFYRTDKARTETEKGSGLGLAIVSRIIDGMGGTIHAEHTPGDGLTIAITLPLIRE